MRVLVVGSGGREHALCWALAASPIVDGVLCAPGNDGIARDAECVPVAADDHEGILALCRERGVDLVVVGPEQPLVAGLVDRLQEAGIRAFGPTAAAARLEGSKAFTKEFCRRFGIPTASARIFRAEEQDAALAWLREHGAPVVVKADGLAAGKGVVVAQTLAEAEEAVREAFAGRFGEAGRTLVIEEYLEGEEASLFAVCDGETVQEIGTAQDHKRAFDGDRGPNTGGMGAYSPTPALDGATAQAAMERIVLPAVRGMKELGTPYRGILYAGLMLTAEGPKLLEFNVRFGDPEAQVILPRLMSDFGEIALAAAEGGLRHLKVRFSDEHALCVVLASRGYPGSYVKGTEIRGLGRLAGMEGVLVFHAGTKREDGRWLAVGGRVLNVVGLGRDLVEAYDRAYAAVKLIDWPEGFWRSDIGHRALARLAATDGSTSEGRRA